MITDIENPAQPLILILMAGLELAVSSGRMEV